MKAETIKKILNKGTCNKKELSCLLWELFDIADNPLENKNYLYAIGDIRQYERKIVKTVQFIFTKLLDNTAKLIKCSDFFDDTPIKEEVGVLGHEALINFINAYDWNYFIFIDYESPDKVVGIDYMLDLFDDDCGLEYILNELKQEDIDKIIELLNDSDLFDWSDLNDR